MASLQEQLQKLTQPAAKKEAADTPTQVYDLLAALADVDKEQLRADMLLVDDLNLGSLDIIELAVRFEQKFGIPSEPETYLQLRTIADVLKLADEFQAR
ncbi:acyl carrier protein [Corynebacterium felinum]|uniref:Acyl carrier protein n=1 Tax=Corynebacterium felinum TaxID=131318 RepID=A0ABU2BCC3_9CORY|nr:MULTISPECIES: acyl carrier protein [Corynebacterium]MDF5821197.1 acyl carrier protein [Corynebacterium felinum]MDO4760928.1 acyl carrier protein [Corynebacterium sp.]MDR7356285.1 acyl carrier protein [Corynebacterium felinum]WJY95618.1 Acyl carrier protein [Corynebacterium felinum]